MGVRHLQKNPALCPPSLHHSKKNNPCCLHLHLHLHLLEEKSKPGTLSSTERVRCGQLLVQALIPSGACLMLRGPRGICCVLQREKATLCVSRLSDNWVSALAAAVFPASSLCRSVRRAGSHLFEFSASFTDWEIIFFHKSKVSEESHVPSPAPHLFFKRRILDIHSTSQRKIKKLESRSW